MKFKIEKLFILFMVILFTFIFVSPVFANIQAPEITSESAILVDNYTGTVLYGKNIDEKKYPASITKILTAILAIENCDLNEKATASYNAIISVPSGYSIATIQVGEQLTVEQLLEVLLVHSANDAANVLGEYVGGSIDSFATMMNTKSIEIGCKNSNFVNPSGKHADNHYTTAKDLALIMQYCMKNPVFRRISSMRSCTIPPTNKSPERHFSTTVSILIPNNKDTADNFYYPYAIAGKTGFTTEAKNCLVSVSEKDGLELTSVILGSGHTESGLSYRFLETKEIYNYGYDNYCLKKISSKNDIGKTIEIFNANKNNKDLDLLINEDIQVLAKKSDDISSIKPEIKLNDNIQAPISANQILGKITYSVNNVGYTSDLIASRNIEKSKFPFIPIAIVLVIFIFILLFVLLKLNRKKKS